MSYSELIEGLKKENEEKAKTHGRYAFLKYRDEIEDALNNGYSAIAIWEHLSESGEMPVKYNQFTVYIRKLIKDKRP